MPSNPLQKSSFKALRKKDHHESEEVDAYQNYLEIGEDKRLTQRHSSLSTKEHIHIPFSTLYEADLSSLRTIRLLYHQRAKSDAERPNIPWIAWQPSDLENAFDLCMRDLVLYKSSITTLSVASLHLKEVISANGRRRTSGQRNSSNGTRCITCLQRRNLQRLLFAGNGQRQASLHPRRQAIYKQRRAPHTRIQVMRLCLKGMLAAIWANTSRGSRRQARDFAKLYSTTSKSPQRIQSFAMTFSTRPAKDYVVKTKQEYSKTVHH